MKRNSFALGLLALTGLACFVTDADAFFRRPLRCRGCHRYTTQITCRPYNAFTPICWGNLICDGCTPSPCGVAGGQLPFQYMGGYGGYAGMMGCSPPMCMGGMCPAPCYSGGMMGCPSGTCLPDTTTPVQPATPMPAGPNFTPPPPAPATSYYYPGGYNQRAYGMNPYGLTQASYYPNYNANYYSAYNAYQQAAYNAYSMAMYNWYRANGGR
jgi:hypothetical protein